MPATLVTNNHVVDGAAKISVTFSDGSSYDATWSAPTPTTDLAVIQVTRRPCLLAQARHLGDSTQVQVGQLVMRHW